MEILGLIFLFVLMAVFSIGFGTLLAVTTSETKTIEELLIDKCIVLIDKYENPLSLLGTVSCKTKMIEKIKLATSNTNIPIDNLDKTCHILLGNIAFSLLASGEYHIYKGQLNVLGMAPALNNVFIKSTQWLHYNGHITNEEYKNAMNNLNKAISEVG